MNKRIAKKLADKIYKKVFDNIASIPKRSLSDQAIDLLFFGIRDTLKNAPDGSKMIIKKINGCRYDVTGTVSGNFEDVKITG